jgi:hypothetical protein
MPHRWSFTPSRLGDKHSPSCGRSCLRHRESADDSSPPLRRKPRDRMRRSRSESLHLERLRSSSAQAWRSNLQLRAPVERRSFLVCRPRLLNFEYTGDPEEPFGDLISKSLSGLLGPHPDLLSDFEAFCDVLEPYLLDPQRELSAGGGLHGWQAPPPLLRVSVGRQTRAPRSRHLPARKHRLARASSYMPGGSPGTDAHPSWRREGEPPDSACWSAT